MEDIQWDDANRAHIARHNVSPEEVEELFASDILEVEVQHENDEERFLWIGETARGRILSVVFTERGEGIRPVTAYEPHPFLRRRYETRKGVSR